MKAYQRSKEQVIIDFKTNNTTGLTKEQVASNKGKYGLNKLPEKRRDSWFKVFFRQFQSPLIYILLIAAAIIFFVGHDRLDAFIISGVLFFNAIIGTIQEGRARNILESLKRFIKAESVVIRDGQKFFISNVDLVPGDLVLLLEGERVPADVRIIESNDLKIDEAVLTGESKPVQKVSGAIENIALVPDQKNMAFKGTYILSGSGKAIVVSTGSKTQIGKIHKATEVVETEMPLRRELSNLSRWIIIFILVLCVVIFVIGFATGKPIRELLVMLTALFICVIPEGLPVVLTLVLVMGAYRMAKRNVLVKRMQAVEALGQTNIILIDKTGTLTRNELMVSKIVSGDKIFTVSGLGYFSKGDILLNGRVIDPTHYEGLEAIGRAGCFLNRAEVSHIPKQNVFDIKGDPTEASMFVMGQKLGICRDGLDASYKKIYEIPFSSFLKYHAAFYQKDGKGIVFISGAPESVMRKANNVKDDDEKRLQELLFEGLRVVAVAIKEFDLDKASKKGEERKAYFEKMVASGLTYVGLCGISDTIRPEVSQLIKNASQAGLSVMMVTGDHKETALYVAKKVGIFKEGDLVVDGQQLSQMSDKELHGKLYKIKVYARVAPAQKLRIAQAFKKYGNIVAMTGDGINDAPSLVAADLGIAMGGIGTEVAKQASDLVLLDDSFASIMFAVEYGRYIFFTLRRVVLYFFATNMGEVLVVLFAIALKMPLPISAAQILWLNLITDGFLDTALAMEKPEKDLLSKSPPFRGRRLVDKDLIAKMMYMALPMGIVSTWIFSLYYRQDIAHARSMTLVTMAMFQWFNAWNCRSETKSVFQLGFFSNRWLLLAIVIVLGLQFFVLHNPIMQRIFGTKPITASQWGLIFLVSSSIFFLEEIRKWVARRRKK